MFCPFCGVENPDEARFCRGCGRPLVEDAPLSGRVPVPSVAGGWWRWWWLLPVIAVVLGVGWWFVSGLGGFGGSGLVEAGSLGGVTGGRLVVAEQVAAGAAAPLVVGLPFPEGSVAEATVMLLEGEAAPLTEFVGVVGLLWDDGGVGCEGLVSSLEALPGPAELSALGWSLPDQVARDVLTNLVAVTVDYVAECPDDEALAEVGWQWSVAVRRLGELGVVLP